MKKTLKQILIGTLIAGALITSPGCSKKDQEINFKPEYNTLCANITGRWYKYPDGSNDKSKWHWGNLYLDQSGPNIWGSYQWEEYGSCNVKGYITGNKFYLESESDDKYALTGRIKGDALQCNNNMLWGGFGSQTFRKISRRTPLFRIKKDL